MGTSQPQPAAKETGTDRKLPIVQPATDAPHDPAITESSLNPLCQEALDAAFGPPQGATSCSASDTTSGAGTKTNPAELSGGGGGSTSWVPEYANFTNTVFGIGTGGDSQVASATPTAGDTTNTSTSSSSTWAAIWNVLEPKTGSQLASVSQNAQGEINGWTTKTANGSTIEATTNGVKETNQYGTTEQCRNGQVESTSADGTDHYTREANGMQRFEKQGGIDVTYNQSQGSAQVRDLPGGVQETMTGNGSDTGAGNVKTLPNGKQVYTSPESSSQANPADMKSDQLYFYAGDGTLAVKHNGNVYYYHRNHETDVVTANGTLHINNGRATFKSKDDHSAGAGVEVNSSNIEQVQQQVKDNKGQSILQSNGQGGTELNSKATAPKGVQIDQGQNQVQAKIPDCNDKHQTATVTAKQGRVEFDVPNELRTVTDTQGEIAYNEQPGHQNERLFSYNFTNHDFNTPDIDFTPQGTELAWNGDTISPDGTVTDDDGTALISGAATAQSSADSQAAEQEVAAVMQTLGSSPDGKMNVAALSGVAGDISRALMECAVANNPGPVSGLMAALDRVTAMSGAAIKPEQETQLAYNQGIFDQSGLQNILQSGNMTADAAVSAEVSRRNESAA